MATKCVVTGPVPAWAKAEFDASRVEVQEFGIKDFLDEALFKSKIADADIFVCGGFEEMTRPVFQAAKKLRLVVFLGSDWEKYIDGAAAAEKKVAVRNTPGANANAVAEFTVGLAIASTRNLFALTSGIQRGQWLSHFGSELASSRVGLVGLGAVGGKVASILRNGFGSQVAYTARSRKPELEAKLQLTWKPLEDLVAWANIISLHAPSTAAASGPLLDRRLFAAMGKGKILINTSPPSLVDPTALQVAIEDGVVQRAVFDTFYVEGDRFADSPQSHLLKLGQDRFVVTPHVAWKTGETDERNFRMAVEIIKNHLGRK